VGEAGRPFLVCPSVLAGPAPSGGSRRSFAMGPRKYSRRLRASPAGGALMPRRHPLRVRVPDRCTHRPGGSRRAIEARHRHHPAQRTRHEHLVGVHQLAAGERPYPGGQCEDVAGRAAFAGYIAGAPDGLSVAGGAPADQEKARDLFTATDRATIDNDIIAGIPYIASRNDGNGKIGAVGFCYGGGMALRCAAERSEVNAAVCFYGSALNAEQIAKVKAPMRMHYAGKDERINAGIHDFRTALDAQAIAYSLHMYPGTQHGFHNDSSTARYDVAAAKLAWARTIALFDSALKSA